MMLAVDAHLVMIDAIARSVRAAPIGGGLHAVGMLRDGQERECAVRTRTAVRRPGARRGARRQHRPRHSQRAAPQLNILSVAFPVQIGIGLVALGASIPFVGAFYRGWSGAYNGTLDHVFAALTRGARKCPSARKQNAQKKRLRGNARKRAKKAAFRAARS